MKSKAAVFCLTYMDVVIDSLRKYAHVAIFMSDSEERQQLALEVNNVNDFAVVLAQDFSQLNNLDQENSINFIVCEERYENTKNQTLNCRILKKIYPQAMIVSIIQHEEFDTVVECLKNGASGVTVKTDNYREVVESLNELQRGGAPLPRSCARRLVESFQRNLDSPLTSRETEVMSRISQGKSYKLIAHELYVHPETVKTHMKNIYSKLNVRSKAAAIEVATKERLI